MMRHQRWHALSWSGLVFIPHFIWIYALVRHHTNASLFLAVGLYVVVVVTFIVVFTCWVWFSSRIVSFISTKWGRVVGGLLSMVMYYLMVSHLGLTMFTGYQEGYPFLNPCIPLAGLLTDELPLPNHFLYLAPQQSCHHPGGDGQVVYHQLTRLVQAHHRVIIAPESFFNFPINLYPSTLALWCCALPPRSIFIFGCTWQEGERLYQAVCGINRDGIVYLYRKKHLIAFVEHMPYFMRNIGWLRSLFLDGVNEFVPHASDSPYLAFEHEDAMICLCSEFFFTKTTIMNEQVKSILFLLNDRWFIDYFRKIIDNLACIKSVWLNSPVLYVGHNNCKLVARKGLHERLPIKRCGKHRHGWSNC